ncbi:MAG: hypothetical protein ACREVZ_14605, partial [Burkholderiales bacterium]
MRKTGENAVSLPKPSAAPHPIEQGSKHRLSLFSAAVCAALASYLPAAHAGPDACSGSDVVLCEGNQSAGVQFSGVSVLNVLNLSTDITPASG